MRLFKYFSIFAALVFAGYFFLFQDNPYQEINGRAFGTYYNIKIRTDYKNRSLLSKVKTVLDNVNSRMSVFEPGSEINDINEAPAGQLIELSDEMSYLLENTNSVYRLTNGNFDPSVGQLVDLWGFGAGKHKDIPTDQEIKDTLKNVGFNKLIFSADYQTVRKNNSHFNINLSAIAKGYAVDKVAEMLKKEGYKDFVVEIGGEVLASGEKSDQNAGWNIGIARPGKDTAADENAVVIRLHNLAVATSGDYRNYYYKDNKRYSHTISPQTGYPVEHNLASVTVFDKSCMRADAIATGLMVMGEKKAMSFANQQRIPVIMFVHDEKNGSQMLVSKEAQKLLNKYEIKLNESSSNEIAEEAEGE